MSESEQILVNVDNKVATLQLNNPERLNALNQVMRLTLMRTLEHIEANDDIRVVIITGRGRAFSAGADLTEGMPGYDNFIDQCKHEYTPWLMSIHNSSKIYIAAVNGACAGIGTAVAMNCDLMIMADDAYLYQAFAAIGLMPDGGANWLLLQKLGYARAFEMAVSAGRLNASQALELGIANKVVAADDLLGDAQTWAAQLAQGAPLAHAATKNLMRRALGMTYQEVIEEEAVLQTELINSEDATNARDAFLAKQTPVFKGR